MPCKVQIAKSFLVAAGRCNKRKVHFSVGQDTTPFGERRYHSAEKRHKFEETLDDEGTKEF